MATYEVMLPVAGHAVVTVEADDGESAVQAALDKVQLKDLQEWEALEQFNMGNVCFCPRPWEAEAERLDGGDEEDGE